jgi:hypothetical protein
LQRYLRARRSRIDRRLRACELRGVLLVQHLLVRSADTWW